MFFSAISVVSSFEMDDDTDDHVSIGQEKNDYTSLRHIDAIRSRMKVEWGKPYSTADLSKQKSMEWSGISQSALIPWDLSIRRGGGGAGSESFHF